MIPRFAGVDALTSLYAQLQASGDSEGKTEVDAGDSIVLADASDEERTIAVAVDVDGSAHWTLAVEVPR